MTDYPLKIFLTSLHSDGIAMSVRDYEQLLVIFQTGGNWTVSRLKNVLTAFLANDLEQQELIQRRFDKYFAKEITLEKELPEFDIRQVINDLKALSTKQDSESRKTLSEIKQLQAPELEITPKKSTHKFWYILAGLIIVMIAIIGVIKKEDRPIISEPEKEKSSIELSHRVLDFGFKDLNSATYKPITISNNGSDPLTIQTIKLLNKTPDTFKLSTTQFPIDLKANESLVISVGFFPQKEGVFTDSLDIIHNAENQDESIAIKGTARKSEPEVRKRLYTDVPYVKEIKYVPIEPDTRWKTYGGISIVLLVCLLLYSYYLYCLKKGPKDKKAEWSKDGPQFFDPGSIGGKPGPRLDENTIAYLADSMGYFKSETPGKALNLANSIKSTVHSGGIPSCEFFTRKRIRTLLILEDAYAEALDWNPVPKELAEGMKRFGIPVIYGRFRGSPDKFKIQDGSVFHLDDLEDHSNGIVMLIFTDGKSFQGLKKSFSLEALARWPMVAWMELRDQRFWDESSDLAMKYKIPIFPATASGLVQAIQLFLTEQGLRDKASVTTNENKHLPNIFNKNSELWIEHFLGDALPWAQDCSMIQPISSSMAQNLREKFYPHLSADEIECLHALPNTTTTESTIHFSNEILKVLRNGFMSRKSEDEQNQVILYILEQIEAAKPDVPEDSLAYLSWESIKERVRLELGSEDDLERFSELLNSPLGNSISDKIDKHGFSDDKISIRKPKSKKAKEHLAKICGNPLGIHLISRMHKVCFVIVLFSFIISFLGLIIFFNDSKLPKNEFRITFKLPTNEFPKTIKVSTINLSKSELQKIDRSVLRLKATSTDIIHPCFLEVWNGNEWELGTNDVISNFFHLRSKDTSVTIVVKNNKSKYRLLLFGNHYYSTKEFKISDQLEIDLDISEKDVETGCIEEYPKMGLTIFRCSEKMSITDGYIKSTSWKNRLNSNIMLQNRNMSVGLEFIDKNNENSELISFRNRLLETSSVDILFHIYSHNPDQQQQSLLKLKKEILPYINFSQLIVWSNGVEYDLEQLNAFDRILNLGDISSWIQQLQKIFEPDVNITISEEEILNKLVNSQAFGEGQPVVLFRPELIKKEFALAVATVPEDAHVRILNILPEYKDGILLKPGSYDVEIAKDGYKMRRETIEIINEDKNIEIVLSEDYKTNKYVAQANKQVKTYRTTDNSSTNKINYLRAPNLTVYNNPSEIWDQDNYDQIQSPWVIFSSKDNVPIYSSNAMKRKIGTANFLDKFKVIKKKGHSLQVVEDQTTSNSLTGWTKIENFLIFPKALQTEHSIPHKAIINSRKNKNVAIKLRHSPDATKASLSNQYIVSNSSEFYYIFQYYPNDINPEYVLLAKNPLYLPYENKYLTIKSVVLGWVPIKFFFVWKNRYGYIIQNGRKDNFSNKMKLVMFDSSSNNYDDDNVIFINKPVGINQSEKYKQYVLLTRREIEDLIYPFNNFFYRYNCIIHPNSFIGFYYQNNINTFESMDQLTIEKAFNTKFGIQLNIDNPLFKLAYSRFKKDIAQIPKKDLVEGTAFLCDAYSRLKNIYDNNKKFFKNFQISHVWIESTLLSK